MRKQNTYTFAPDTRKYRNRLNRKWFQNNLQQFFKRVQFFCFNNSTYLYFIIEHTDRKFNHQKLHIVDKLFL